MVKSFEVLMWGDDYHDPKLPHEYDIRDLVRDRGHAGALRYVFSLLKPMEIGVHKKEHVEAIPCVSFDDLASTYRKSLHFNKVFESSLTVSLAVVISTDIKGDQLWFRLIGPPGCGKSTIAEAISVAKEYVYPLDIFTGIASGNRSKRKKDSTLISDIQGKCTIIQDGDTLISSQRRDAILAELRAMYGGNLRGKYRNDVEWCYEDFRNTMIICGTSSLRILNRTNLGERFLDCDVFADSKQEPYLNRAFANTFDLMAESFSTNGKVSNPQLIKGSTYGFLKHLKEVLPSVNLRSFQTEDLRIMVESLGRYISLMRSRVEASEDAPPITRVELATRLVAQLSRLAACVAVVLGEDEITDRVRQVVRKVVIDTSFGGIQDIFRCLLNYPDGLDRSQISEALSTNPSSVRHKLWHMKKLRMVTVQGFSNNSGVAGRDRHVWKLTRNMRALYNRGFK